MSGHPATVIGSAVSRWARRDPGRPAVVEARLGGTRGITWRELDVAASDRAADIMRVLNCRTSTGSRTPTTRCVLAVPAANTMANVISLIGALRTGLPVLPISEALPGAERERLLAAVAGAHGPVWWLGDGEPSWTPGAATWHDQRTVNYLMASGGTSGMPRAIGCSIPRESAGGIRLLWRRTGWTEGMCQLIVGPLSHAAPFTCLVSGLLDGHTIVVQGAFSAEKALTAVEVCRVEWMQVTPSHMRAMLQGPAATPECLGSLRALLHTAAPCDTLTKRSWIELLGPDRVFEMYGATEQIGMTLARGDEWLGRPGTVGRGFLTQIRIVDDTGAALPAGAVGRVFMRRGRRPGQSVVDAMGVERTVDGYRHVGDHGYLDQDGYLYLVGRRSDMMIVGGANVYPAELERIILELPGVADVAVVEVPDAGLGAVPHAYVVAHPESGLTVGDVTRHCRAALAVHKRPRHVEMVARLPRNESGKLQRWRLFHDGQGVEAHDEHQ